MENFKKINRNELAIYMNKMNNGDMDARNKVIYHYSNTIIRIIEKNYNNGDFNKEDLFQAGMCGLLLALKRYGKHNSNTLNAIIHQYIEKEIDDFINQEKIEIEILPKYVKEPIEYIEKKDLLNSVFKEIDKLSEKDKEFIYLYFYENYRIADIARLWNKSRNTIEFRKNKIIGKIKEQIYINNIINNQNNLILEALKDYLIYKREEELINHIENEGNSEIIKLVLKHVKYKPIFDKNVIYAFFFENYTLNQISKTYNKKYPTIKAIIDKCIDDIRLNLFPFSDKNFEGESFSVKIAKIYRNQLH